MPKLTQRLIDSLRPEGRDRIVFDATVPGFGVRVFRSGRKSYVIQYRSQKRTRRFTLGNCNVLTLPQARKRAASLLARVRDGEDPAQTRLEGLAAPTVAHLVERFLRDHSAKKKTGAEDRRNLEKDILPVLGRRLVESVKCRDMDKLHAAIGGRAPITANRVLAVASTMFGLAERWGMRGGNEPMPPREAFSGEPPRALPERARACSARHGDSRDRGPGRDGRHRGDPAVDPDRRAQG